MIPYLRLQSQQWWVESLSHFESLLPFLQLPLLDEHFCLSLLLLKAYVVIWAYLVIQDNCLILNSVTFTPSVKFLLLCNATYTSVTPWLEDHESQNFAQHTWDGYSGSFFGLRPWEPQWSSFCPNLTEGGRLSRAGHFWMDLRDCGWSSNSDKHHKLLFYEALKGPRVLIWSNR